jgi:hypothetical protein
LRFISGTGIGWHRTGSVGNGDYRYRHRPPPTGTGTYRYRPVLTELDRHRHGLFYDVFDYTFLGYLIQTEYQNVIKQPGPVGAGLFPVCAGTGSPQCRPAPSVAGAADRPQETLFVKFSDNDELGGIISNL